MFSALTIWIEHSIIAWGALGVFVSSVLEEIVVIIPSVLVQAGAGLFLLSGVPIGWESIGKLIVWVALPSALGVAVGSLLIYALAYYGGRPALRRFGKYFFLSEYKLESARADIVSRPSTIYFITILRFVPLFPNSIITACAGLLRIPLKQYMISTIVGIFVRALYLGAIGWMTGSIYGTGHERSFFSRISMLFGVLLAVSLLTGMIINCGRRPKKIR